MYAFLAAIFLICSAISVPAQQPAPAKTAEPNVPTAAPSATASQTPAPTVSEPKTTVSSVHVDGPYIALTFDDGPNEKLTPRLLDLLAQHHIHATFFVVGENAARYPEILQRAVREGHEIGNHSWSHPNLAKMSDDAVRSQIKRTEDAIVKATGIRPTLLRPPYGSITAHQKRWLHDEFGYEIVLWDVDPLDWKNPGPSVVTNRVLKETRPGSIVLSHDIHAQTIESEPETLRELEAKGFKFVTVSELLKMQTAPTPKPVNAAVRPAASPSG
ncbi:MAG: polysaccharide deacetylase family protein [Verrucomicrobia bacterium]|nr:polysaccharide deacetylase family protein [Verrucomicrobiota bacterium]